VTKRSTPEVFTTRFLKSGTKRRGKLDATAVVHKTFKENGQPLTNPQVSYKKGKTIVKKRPVYSIVTIFMGSDGGKSEAERLCEMLNFAYQAFYKGVEIGEDYKVKDNTDTWRQ
jgi:hypothetical protein